MSPVLPFDIIALIIDIVGENKDTDLLKKLALVSHSFLHICSKHLFATVKLHSATSCLASSKKGFVKLLKSRPDVVKYIRKLKYSVSRNDDDDDHLLSPILLNFLPTFSRLNCLKITGTVARHNWNTLNSPVTSALLHLMHLPTITHIDLSFIRNFPLSSLTPSVNLLRFQIYLCISDPLEEDGSPEIASVVEMIPKFREFYTLESSRLTTKLLHAKKQDGRPAFNFMDLRQFSTSFKCFEDERNIRYLLQNAKLLEKLLLGVVHGRSLVGLLSPSAGTLKVLHLSVRLWDSSVILGGTCEELEALAGHNMLEAFSFEVRVNELDTADHIGPTIQKVEKVLVKPGWSALRQVSFKVSITHFEGARSLIEELQSLPDKYLCHLSKLESVTFKYLVDYI
jgi:hypothetical protein